MIAKIARLLPASAKLPQTYFCSRQTISVGSNHPVKAWQLKKLLDKIKAFLCLLPKQALKRHETTQIQHHVTDQSFLFA